MPTVFLNPERQTPKDIDRAIRNLKKKVEAAGILKELHERQHYKRPGIKRNEKKKAAIARWRSEQAKAVLPPKMY